MGSVNSMEKVMQKKELSARDTKYLYGVARNFIGLFGGFKAVSPYLRNIGSGGGVLYATVSDELQHRWSVERMGKIASLGASHPSDTKRTSLLEIHRGDRYIDKNESGDTILIRVATTTILAAMRDLVIYEDKKHSFIDSVKY